MFKRLLIVPLALMPLLASANGSVEERVSISLGAFFTDRDTRLRLDGSAGRGTETDLEGDLGLDRRNQVFRVDGYYRFKGSHRLDFSVFDLSRSAVKQLDKAINWGDEVFQIDTVLTTEVDLEIWKAAYTYEFRESETGYLGATAGLYVADMASRLIADSLGQRDIRSLTAPLPVIGLRGDHEFADRWTIRASGEFFFLEYDNHKGFLGDLYAAVDYGVTDNMSVGIGLNTVSLNVRSRQSRFDGRLKWRYTGALLFLKFDF